MGIRGLISDIKLTSLSILNLDKTIRLGRSIKNITIS